VIGRIIGQADGEVISLSKLHEALHELRPSAVALWGMTRIRDFKGHLRPSFLF
jgi:hypothetical protein